MLDPLNSLSLITNIVTLVDFGSKAIKQGREIASKGTTAEHEGLRRSAANITSLCNIARSKVEEQTPTSPNPANVQNVDERPVILLANKAQSVAEELEMLLNGLKIDDTPQSATTTPTNSAIERKRKRTVAKQVMKSIWRDSDLQKLKKQLDELQRELILSLTTMQSQTCSGILHELGGINEYISKGREERLDDLEKVQSKLQERAKRSFAQPTDLDTLFAGLDALNSQAKTVATCQRILRALAFEEIDHREEIIPQAHSETFAWIFENPDLGFIEWASKKNGLFWITGKPGSGKSTLMKFLVRHPRTAELLQEWSDGGKKVVIAHHYIWNAGTSMQKSQASLLRTLLSHLIRECPETTINLARQKPYDVASTSTITELRKMLEAFCQRPDLGARICFFIDGLDEYDGDLDDLVEYLEKLSASPNVKLCIASRLCLVFCTTFGKRANGRLQLQDLTKPDIEAYISDKLDSSRFFSHLRQVHGEGCTALIREICEKAEGMFLWVHLVVRSLMRGLNNHDSLQILRERVAQCPNSLFDYFNSMLGRIESIYHRHSARLILAALESRTALPSYAPYLLDRELENPSFAIHLHIDRKDETIARFDLGASKRYLEARCADFLEVGPHGISFIHRAARDFFEHRDLLDMMSAWAGFGYDVSLSLGRIALAEIKTEGIEFEELSSSISLLTYIGRTVKSENTPAFLALLTDLRSFSKLFFDPPKSSSVSEDERRRRLAILRVLEMGPIDTVPRRLFEETSRYDLKQETEWLNIIWSSIP